MAELGTYEMDHTIAYYECDRTGAASLSMLVAMIIMASEKQNEELGVDVDQAMKFGGTWVIINYEADFMGDLPHEGAHIKVGTNIQAYNQFFVLRKFWVKDAKGQTVATFVGTFVYMDLKARKLTKIPAEIMKPYQVQAVKRVPHVKAPQSLDVSDQWQSKQYQVRYFDIDYNGHVNNARYFDWMLDPLGGEFLMDHHITKMMVKFEHEVRPSAVATSKLYVENGPDDSVVSHHKIFVGAELCTEADFIWQKINKSE